MAELKLGWVGLEDLRWQNWGNEPNDFIQNTSSIRGQALPFTEENVIIITFLLLFSNAFSILSGLLSLWPWVPFTHIQQVFSTLSPRL